MIKILFANLFLIFCLHAQLSQFLNHDEIMMLVNEISGDRAYEHIRVLSQWHRDSGMDGYFKAADYVMQQAKLNGLEDISFIEQKLDHFNYTAKSAELWIVEPVEFKLADLGDHALFLSDNSHSADIKNAELVYVGKATENECELLDLKGKIVLTNSTPNLAFQNAVKKFGAVGIICYTSSEMKSQLDFPDQLAWTRLPSMKTKNETGTFSFNLSPRRGEQLREILQSNETRDFLRINRPFKAGRLVLKAKVNTEFKSNQNGSGRTGFVSAWIKGGQIKDQDIVITAHLQEEQGSANDDGSGCGNILELGRVLKKLIDEGKIKRPERNIRFWWSDEIYSEYRYFSDFPNEKENILLNLHQDMTGAKQSIGSRTQNLIFAPFSRLSYLDAVFEDIGNFVILSNNPFITAGRMGKYSRPHSVEIYAKRGSRENFNARFVPFFNASDNYCFVDGIIGIPSVALINWDDSYIHSSDDDLWQIDQTQLKRNNFIIAAMAYYFGKMTEKEIPSLLMATYSQAIKRLARDKELIKEKIDKEGDNSDLFKQLTWIINAAIDREKQAIQSVLRVHSKKSSLESVRNYHQNLEKTRTDLFRDIKFLFKERHRKEIVDSLVYNDLEKKAMCRIPLNNSSLNQYFENRSKVRVANLTIHPTMRFELFSFIDGKRSVYDIFTLLKAESWHQSEFLYGSVLLEDVVALIDEAVKEKALSYK